MIEDASQYHTDAHSGPPSLSSHIAKILLRQSPRHAWFAHPRLNPNYREEEKDEFDFGTVAHAILLEGSETKICEIDAPDWRTKAAKEQRETARANGLTPILVHKMARVLAMVKAAQQAVEESEFTGIFARGKPEQSIRWQEGETHCRGRIDWLTDDRKIVLDYKTTGDCSPDGFGRQIPRMGYDIQGSFYLRGMRALGADPVFILLAQENEPPFDCTFHSIAPSLMTIADAAVQFAIDEWANCMTTGRWPGYSKRVHWLEATSWQMQQHESALMEDEE